MDILNEEADLDQFITKFGGVTEEYKFYDGSVTLRYDVKKHVYLLVTPDGTLEPQDGCTTICHIIDKSNVLLPWACKMMANKLHSFVDPVFREFDAATFEKQDLDEWIQKSKSAHKDKLEDAGEVGHKAHAWIEKWIKNDLASTDFSMTILEKDALEVRAQNCSNAALAWMQAHNIRWRFTERKVYSREFKYAGTMDGLALVDSCNDPKCCKQQFKDHLAVIDWKSSNYLYVEYVLQTAAYRQAYQEETGEQIEDIFIVRLGKEDGEFEAWHIDSSLAEHGWDAFLKALGLSRAMVVLNQSVDDAKDERKAIRKAEKQAEKKAQLTVKCSYADKYKGVRAPQCNNGNPCDFCKNKYQEVQLGKEKKK